MKRREILLGLLSLFFLYPIVVYVTMYKLGILVEKLPHNAFWQIVQVLLSGPALIIIGMVYLFSMKQKRWYPYLGGFLIIAGIILLVEIGMAIVEET